MPSLPIPERPILVSPSLACQLGVEAATLMAILADYSFHQPARVRNGYNWYRLTREQTEHLMPFWSPDDIQRLSQTLRSRGQLLLASAPFASSGELKFAFNQKLAETPEAPAPAQARGVATSAPMSADWSPSEEIFARLAQQGIPENFTREQIPEFVTYWRERGESHRTWGSKFQNYIVRRWRQFEDRRAREQKQQAQQTPLPENWQPDEQVIAQLSQESIPLAHIEDCANRFRLYYRETGTVVASWSMTFYAWVKKDWEEKQVPFLANRKPVPMTSDWQPAAHTKNYLQQLDIDGQFIDECVPEFVHKWIEQGSFRNNWGDVFSQHVSNQWAHFRQGISANPTASIIGQDWQPSPECLDLLQNQCEMALEFVQAQIPEFVLYWRNRAEPKHSWDSIFIRHLKYIWARQHQLSAGHSGANNGQNEKQQPGDRPSQTRDIPLAQRLTDRSWAY